MPSASLLKNATFVTLLAVAAWAQGQQGAPAQQPSSGNNQIEPPAASPQTQNPQGSTGTDQEGTFVFKRQVQEVVLHATVVDGTGRLESHLDRSAFSVFEDGKPQTITAFRREDVPVAIGIVIDNSSSMRDKREQVNRAVLNLIRASNPQDEVFVVNFTQNSYLDQDFTSDINLLEQALHRSTMRGSTALYDAIVAAAAHLGNNARLEKRMLLVITDGQDNMSRETLQQATRYLGQKDGPTVYAIGLMGLEHQNQGREALEKLSDATGGAAFFPQSLEEVNDIASTLAHDIRRQYTIAYKPKNEKANASYHPIQVEARANGYGKLIVRTRGGYYTGEVVR
jgi:Ca-activated chloride channel homolog